MAQCHTPDPCGFFPEHGPGLLTMEARVHLCCPSGAVLALDQFLRGIADDWESTQDLGERLAKAKQAGASWRLLAYRTGIPMTTVRRWAGPFLPQRQEGGVITTTEHDPDPAVTPPRTAAGPGSPTTLR